MHWWLLGRKAFAAVGGCRCPTPLEGDPEAAHLAGNSKLAFLWAEEEPGILPEALPAPTHPPTPKRVQEEADTAPADGKPCRVEAAKRSQKARVGGVSAGRQVGAAVADPALHRPGDWGSNLSAQKPQQAGRTGAPFPKWAGKAFCPPRLPTHWGMAASDGWNGIHSITSFG